MTPLLIPYLLFILSFLHEELKLLLDRICDEESGLSIYYFTCKTER